MKSTEPNSTALDNKTFLPLITRLFFPRKIKHPLPRETGQAVEMYLLTIKIEKIEYTCSHSTVYRNEKMSALILATSNGQELDPS